jgi:hypothetical protein
LGLLGVVGTAQAALMAYTSDGKDLVLDGQGLTWTADANLFKTQYDADNTVVTQIIAAVPTITHTPGFFPSPYNITASDFNTGNGRMSWFGAMAWAEWLGIIGYGGADDWRLWEADPPCGVAFNCTSNELGYLFYTEGGLSAGQSILADPPGILDDYFANMQSSLYWSGTQYAPDPVSAWLLYTDYGGQDFGFKASQLYGWAVRPGQVAAAPLPATGFLVALGLMALGASRQGRRATLALR